MSRLPAPRELCARLLAVDPALGERGDRHEALRARAVGTALESAGSGSCGSADGDAPGSDELGAWYEELLALEFDPSGGLARCRDTRKRSGSWFTSEALASALTRRALGPLLYRADGRARAVAEIEALAVLDPACGAGVFLSAAAHEVRRAHALAEAQERRSPDPERSARAVLGVVHGIDRDAAVLPLARAVVARSLGVAPGSPELEGRVVHGDALLSEPHGARRFDAVLGNPPWEIEKPDSRQFFERFDPGYRALDKQAALARQRELFRRHPGLEEEWLARQQYARDLREASRARFRRQAVADTNLYKLFVERAYHLLRPGGRLGLLVPSGLYSDLGTRELRLLLLEECAWEDLVSFENQKALFDIHRSYKFCMLVAQRGAALRERPVRAAFGLQTVAELEQVFDRDSGRSAALTAPGPHLVSRADLLARHPSSLAFSELRTPRDAQVLARIDAASVRLGSEGGDAWNVGYRREVDLTNDSHAFLSRAAAEPHPTRESRWLARERTWLPLLEGRMIHQYRPRAKGWVSGAGARARWRDLSGAGPLEPRYLIDEELARERAASPRGQKLVIRDIARATDERSAIACLVSDVPCANTLPVLSCADPRLDAALCALLNSFVLDWALRSRLGGYHLNRYILEELPLPPVEVVLRCPELGQLAARLCRDEDPPRVRRLLSARADALVARLYGLEAGDLEWILRAGEPGAERDPKGFWRVDAGLPAGQRRPALALAWFRGELSRAELTPELCAHSSS